MSVNTSLKVDNISCRLIYSPRRRTIGITVRDAEVVVRAPLGTDISLIEKVVMRHISWIKSKIEKQRRATFTEEVLDEESIRTLKREAKQYFDNKINYYADIMGLKYGRMKITSAKKRFGSCNSKGNICFSYRLMLYPEHFREYVVVHELCHLVYMNHSKKFYSLVEKYMPDYKERRRLAK